MLTKECVDIDTDGDFDEFRHFYYTDGWQLLETRLSTSENTEPETLQPEYQYVWSARYLDAPVLRDKNTDSDDVCNNERLYFANDANMNVTALMGTDGTPLERYVYDPYGKVTIYDGTWTNTRNTSSYDNSILFAGYYHDWETGLYHVRNRYYHPYFGLITRDPAGYVDGMSLYEYVGCAPCVRYDPFGMSWYGDLWDAAKTAAGAVGEFALGVVEAATGAPFSDLAPPTTQLEANARNLGHGTAAAAGAALTAKGIADTTTGVATMGVGVVMATAGGGTGLVVGSPTGPGAVATAAVGAAPGVAVIGVGAKTTAIGIAETAVGGWILHNAMSCPPARVHSGSGGGSSDEGGANTEKPGCPEASKIDREAFKAEREAYWKREAAENPGKYSADDLAKMKQGRAPTGADGYPQELHHVDRTPEGGLEPMDRTDHRLGENYKKNHP